MNHLTDDPDPTDDELIARLRSARPTTPEALTSPSGAAALALRQEILMQNPEPTPIGTAPRRRRLALAVAGIAAATVAVTVVATSGGTPTGDHVADPSTSVSLAPSDSAPDVDLADIELIAARSGEALARSGRAVVKFASDVDGDQFIASAGTSTLAFSGDDIEMTIVFDGSDASSPERGSFTAQNKTVGGEFYLLDGPIGDKKWIHDTNAGGGRGSEIFNVDPRTLFSLFSADAGFELVGTDDIDGVSARHFRSTEPVAAASLDFGLGPVGEVDSTADVVDIWVGDDDVTQRVDLQLSYHADEVDTATAPLVGKNPDGSITLTAKDGTVTVIPQGAPFPDLPMTKRLVRSTYSVQFSDIGAPIDITAPADATDVAGVG